MPENQQNNPNNNQIQLARGNYASGLYGSQSPIIQEGLDLLASGRNLAGVLPRYIEEEIAAEVIRNEREGNPFVQDLIANNLVRPFPQWVRRTKFTQNKTGGGVNAWRTMDPDVRGERGNIAGNSMSWPVFATCADFSEGFRTLELYNSANQPFDTSMTAEGTYSINTLIEDQAWNGWNSENSTTLVDVGGATAPGVFSSPVNTFTYTGSNPSWTHASKKGTEIVKDVQGMADVLRDNGLFLGPFVLWVNPAYDSALNGNFSDGVTTFDKSIRTRLTEMTFGGVNLRVKSSAWIPTDKTLLIQYTRNVIEVLLGQSPDILSWRSGNGLRYYWMLVASVVTLIKSNYSGQQGYVVGDVP